ncbi:hypothetical protein INS49_002112 [Diaporthe citri]|uniref:uncharacterized protein n=1 Tax=Diaporthe citri TaxID=83186 RepID=UPI001C812E18|nr:uncharacterized protein INS49_002112 [Diaporthe citri]KAG6367912.1 hypothetical protein INS49_002112 [Diaporthe citri]
MRNAFVGLLDETLHTPEYVYSVSFTLSSVVCALGCAVSLNPRDRALHPVLLSLATGNISWCVAASVKPLEVIQAIINMQFWAPISPRQSDDPYWLYLVYVRIDRPATIAEHLPILAFYMDHSLLVLHAQAPRDITTVNEPNTSAVTLTISPKTLEVATRTLDLVLTDRTMSELLLGLHNNQYIMICHAATEILRAIQRGGLTAAEVSEAAGKLRMLAVLTLASG